MAAKKRGVSQSKRAKLAGLPKPKKSPPKSIPPKIKKKAGAMVQEVYDRPAMLKLIFDRVSSGEFVTDVLKDLKVSAPTFYDWTDETEETSKAYARAKVKQARSIADEVQRIADGQDKLSLERRNAIDRYARQLRKRNAPGWQAIIRGLEGNLVARNRLQMDARKWFARSLNPREFGDKIDMTSGGEPMPTTVPTVLVQFVGPDGRPVMPENQENTKEGRG